MTIETNTKVEQVNVVQDGNGDKQAPANEPRQQEIRDSLANQAGLTAFEYSTPDTNVNALPSNPVPDGVDIVIFAMDANGGFVWIGDDSTQSVPIKPGGSLTLAVSDTGNVYVQTPTAGDTVGVLFEDG